MTSGPDGVVPAVDLDVWLLPDDGSFTAEDGHEIRFTGFEPCFNSELTHRVVLNDEQLVADRTFYCRVVGTTHYSEALERPEVSVGRQVGIVPEPNNPFDPHALRVFGRAGATEFQIGYVPKELARQLAPHQNGKGGVAVVVATFHRDGRRIGFRIFGGVGGVRLGLHFTGPLDRQTD